MPSLLAAPVFYCSESFARISGFDTHLVVGAAISLFTVLIGAITPCLFTMWLGAIDFPPPIALLGGATLAFASSHWHHSVKGFYSEPYATLFIMIALLAAVKNSIFVSGLCVGLACLCRVQLVTLAPLIGIYALVSGSESSIRLLSRNTIFQRVLIFGAGFGGPMLFLVWSNWIRFGSPVKTGYHLAFPSTSYLFATPLWEGLRGILVDPEVGLLLYSPWVLAIPLLCFISLGYAQRELILAATVCATQLVFFAKYATWHGGWSFGPRLLVPFLPFFVMLFTFAVAAVWRMSTKWPRNLLFTLIAGTVMMHCAISLYPMNRYYLRYIYESSCGVKASPPLAIAALWEVPQLMRATTRGNTRQIVTDEGERLRSMERLGKNGVCSYASAEDYLAATPNAINQMTIDVLWLKLANFGLRPWLGLALVIVLFLASPIVLSIGVLGWKKKLQA